MNRKVFPQIFFTWNQVQTHDGSYLTPVACIGPSNILLFSQGNFSYYYLDLSLLLHWECREKLVKTKNDRLGRQQLLRDHPKSSMSPAKGNFHLIMIITVAPLDWMKINWVVLQYNNLHEIIYLYWQTEWQVDGSRHIIFPFCSWCYLSESEGVISWHVMKCHDKRHDFSPKVTKCHQMSQIVIKCHHVKLKDILWHLMT